MTDYSKGKIYMLYVDCPEVCYIGSTTQTLKKRLRQHKTGCVMWKNGKGCYVSSYQLFETGKEVIIELVENFPCSNRYELETRERFHIENIRCINKQIPTRSRVQRYQDHKAEIALKSKQYREEHKTEIALKNKQYREEHKAEIALKTKQYYEEHKAEIILKTKQYREQYYEAHKAEFALKNKQYYEAHKEAISEKTSEKIACLNCGSMVRKYGIVRHQRTEKCRNHKNLISSQ